MGYFIVFRPTTPTPLLDAPSPPPNSIAHILLLHRAIHLRNQRRPSAPQHSRLLPPLLAVSGSGVPGDEAPGETPVQELRVPTAWLSPSIALQESEWLREALHKWLDDEYCPEPANVEISRVAARSYYESLMEQQSDLGEILLKMARDLDSVSFQESFHGAFSSANAAIHLITSRMNSTTTTSVEEDS